MDDKNYFIRRRLFFLIGCLILGMIAHRGFAQEASSPANAPPQSDFPLPAAFANTKKFEEDKSPVELNGDLIEFLHAENKMIATGHVVMTKGDTRLTCDRVEFFRDTKMTVADGHVVLSTPTGKISGDHLTYNFDKMSGEFMGAKIFADPYYGAGQKVSKIDEHRIQMARGYLTTCDLDKPHFRLFSKKVDVYPGDKMIARSVRMIVGNVPLAYIPRFSQALDDRKPRVIYTPGYTKEWGAFLLQDWRLYFNDNVKGHLRLDYREKRAFAPGLDLNYKTPNKGEGFVRLYYMNELTPQRKHFWQLKTGKTIYAERFRAEWRHKWTIDDKTEALWQYSVVHDDAFIKDYFKREYQKDPNPPTFFLITRTLPKGALSFRMDKRINRYSSSVERLPEIQYNFFNQALGETGFYLNSADTYSNLSGKDASPTEIRRETMRVDSDNKLSYPMKVGFIEFTPNVGQRETYYSKTKDIAQYDVVRSAFSTGADLSAKFYKVYDSHTKLWGMEINRLRHIITPAIAYQYRHKPTLSSDVLDSFDAVDSLTRDHFIGLSLENKWQTKRQGTSVDLLRVLWSSPFNLKEHIGKGSFDTVRSDIEFKPVDWLTFHSDTAYDPHRELLSSANFDLYVNNGEKWTLGFGKRYSFDSDDQITTDFKMKVNPKWTVRFYERFDINKGLQKAQEFTVTRDLHEWEMEVNFNEIRGQGSELWLVFRLKAFPEMTLDFFGTSFNRRKTGSQSLVGQ